MEKFSHKKIFDLRVFLYKGTFLKIVSYLHGNKNGNMLPFGIEVSEHISFVDLWWTCILLSDFFLIPKCHMRMWQFHFLILFGIFICIAWLSFPYAIHPYFIRLCLSRSGFSLVTDISCPRLIYKWVYYFKILFVGYYCVHGYFLICHDFCVWFIISWFSFKLLKPFSQHLFGCANITMSSANLELVIFSQCIMFLVVLFQVFKNIHPIDFIRCFIESDFHCRICVWSNLYTLRSWSNE